MILPTDCASGLNGLGDCNTTVLTRTCAASPTRRMFCLTILSSPFRRARSSIMCRRVSSPKSRRRLSRWPSLLPILFCTRPPSTWLILLKSATKCATGLSGHGVSDTTILTSIYAALSTPARPDGRYPPYEVTQWHDQRHGVSQPENEVRCCSTAHPKAVQGKNILRIPGHSYRPIQSSPTAHISSDLPPHIALCTTVGEIMKTGVHLAGDDYAVVRASLIERSNTVAQHDPAHPRPALDCGISTGCRASIENGPLSITYRQASFLRTRTRRCSTQR
ncbi:hypothetical protein DFH09DRAFT_1368265, partial [Mycena vulgaris]